VNNFYDELAESYHLIFDNWDAAIVRQRDVLARLLPIPANGNGSSIALAGLERRRLV
jgi:glycine/sarcosine N-methyltransferase